MYFSKKSEIFDLTFHSPKIHCASAQKSVERNKNTDKKTFDVFSRHCEILVVTYTRKCPKEPTHEPF